MLKLKYNSIKFEKLNGKIILIFFTHNKFYYTFYNIIEYSFNKLIDFIYILL